MSRLAAKVDDPGMTVNTFSDTVSRQFDPAYSLSGPLGLVPTTTSGERAEAIAGERRLGGVTTPPGVIGA